MTALDKVLKDINEFLDSKTPEELEQFYEVCNRFEDEGQTVDEYLDFLKKHHTANSIVQTNFCVEVKPCKQPSSGIDFVNNEVLFSSFDNHISMAA